MPFGEVRLIPGLNVEKTPTLNEAGISSTQLVRFRDTLVQKLGGWEKFYSFPVAGVPRDLHAWEDLNNATHLGFGTTTQLGVITSGAAKDITPQTLTSDLKPTFQATATSTTITITDPNISNVTTYDTIKLNVPVSSGGAILSGVYPIVIIGSATSYTINSAVAASSTNTVLSNATSNLGTTQLNFTSTPAWVTNGMVVVDVSAYTAIPANAVVASTTATTVILSTALVATAVLGDSIVFNSIPMFTVASGAANATTQLIAHGLATGNIVVFSIPSTSSTASVTVSGIYPIIAIDDANDFSITLNNQATASLTFPMNNGLAEIVYYINLGPGAIGTPYGFGNYGSGAYGGLGSSGGSQTGTEITATDWTSDNWGELFLACPAGGGVYVFDPTGGFANAGLVNTAPPFNGGIFVSTQLQILVCWGSTIKQDLGIQQDPMLVRWSDLGDYTDFVPLTTNQAGSFRIPIGSMIMGGMAVANQNLIWTDLDLWAMNYQGQPFVFGFNKIGAGAGLISSHAAQQLRGAVYWMGSSNFYVFDSSGVRVLPCPVWDAVFQNLDTANSYKVRAAPNTPFNEVAWEFPSAASTGENDTCVKFNLLEQGTPWDVSAIPRSAAIDQTILGPPIQATPTGLIYQHETSPDADGQPLAASFTSGYFYLTEGEDFVYVDQIIPDFKWGTFSGTQGTQIQISFNVINYPGDVPITYGPYTMVNTTEYISVRLRGRQMSVTVSSNDTGSFWRIGKIRYRFAPDGRR